MGSLGLDSLYEPDELGMAFLGQPAPHLPSIVLPSACSHQQSSVIGEHGMPVGGSESRSRRPTSSEQSPSSSDAGPMYQNPRSRFRGPQLEGLAAAYAANPFPTTEDKTALADELQLDTRAVQVWFQNKRARERKALGPQASEHLRRRSAKDGTFPPRTLALGQPGEEVALADVLASESTAGPRQSDAASPQSSTEPHRSAVNNVAENVRIAHDLTVHGEAWKMGGSTQWRVLSDARVKDVLEDFTLGGETPLPLLAARPSPEPEPRPT